MKIEGGTCKISARWLKDCLIVSAILISIEADNFWPTLYLKKIYSHLVAIVKLLNDFNVYS